MIQDRIHFIIKEKDTFSNARAGNLVTPHGIIETPAFVAVGTKASVRSLSSEDLEEIGVQAVMGNTYHLHLRPGEDLIAKMGGLGKFMSWHGPLMTDSGGFQVFSLGVALEHGVGKLLKEDAEVTAKPRLNKITEEGVTFQSHLDGSTHMLTPESSISIQEKLGADLIIGFDDLESPKYSYKETQHSLALTNIWLRRSLQAHTRGDQLLYGVTHGGPFEDLRIESAKFVDNNFNAIALGGAHLTKENMYEVVDWTADHIANEKPKHMLGIGEIDDILQIVKRGIDTFDCVIPTRLGRAGFVFVYPPEGSKTNRFRIDITKAKYAMDSGPLSVSCSCKVCKKYTRSYINHLFRSNELSAYRLASYHNVYFLQDVMKKIRASIYEKQFHTFFMNWMT